MSSKTTPLLPTSHQATNGASTRKWRLSSSLGGLIKKAHQFLIDCREEILLLLVLVQLYPFRVTTCTTISFALVVALMLLPALQTHLGIPFALAIYLNIVLILETIGKIYWLKISFSIENIAHKFARDCSTGPDNDTGLTKDDIQALKKSESFDSWGNTIFYKVLPTLISLVWVSITISPTFSAIAATVPMAVVCVKWVIGRYCKISTGKGLLDAKDERNLNTFSDNTKVFITSQRKYQLARQSRILGSYLRQQIWGVIIIVFTVLIRHTALSEGTVVVIGMVCKDIISLDTHLVKLDKSWVAPRGMLDLTGRSKGGNVPRSPYGTLPRRAMTLP